MAEKDKSVTKKEFEEYVRKRQSAFTKQLEEKAEKAGVRVDVKVMVTVMPQEES